MAIARNRAFQEKYLPALQENCVPQLDIDEEILPFLPNKRISCPAGEVPDKEISELLTTFQQTQHQEQQSKYKHLKGKLKESQKRSEEKDEEIRQLKQQVKDRDEVIKHYKITERDFEDLKKRYETLKNISKLLFLNN